MKSPKCKICGQQYLSYYGGEFFEPSCDCEAIQKHEAERQRESKIDQYFIDNNFKVHSKELIPYYENLDWIGKKSLFICGNFGCHKTGQVTMILKKAICEDMSVRYYRTSEIVYQRDYETIKKVMLLVLDNFGKNIKFEDSRNALFDLIDFRLHNYLSTIIITNELLKDKIDGALYDRLDMFEKIIISGKSTRHDKEQTKEKGVNI